MAGLAGRHTVVPHGVDAAVNTQLVFLRLLAWGAVPAERMADTAIDLCFRAMRISRYIDVAFVTGQKTVHRLFEKRSVDVLFRAFLTVTVITGIFRIGKKRYRTTEGNDNGGEEFHCLSIHA